MTKKKITGGQETGLMPIILATQEAKIRRIAVRSQPKQLVHKTLSQKNCSQKREVGGW
jgi:hypothetical protein